MTAKDLGKLAAQAIESQVYREMFSSIKQSRVPKESWYIGIAADPEDTLFNRHKVTDPSTCIYRNALTDESARNVEKMLLKVVRGAKGCGGGGGQVTTWVYAYVITDQTSQD